RVHVVRPARLLFAVWGFLHEVLLWILMVQAVCHSAAYIMKRLGCNWVYPSQAHQRGLPACRTQDVIRRMHSCKKRPRRMPPPCFELFDLLKINFFQLIVLIIPARVTVQVSAAAGCAN